MTSEGNSLITPPAAKLGGPVSCPLPRVENTVAAIAQDISDHLQLTLGLHTALAKKRDWWEATCFAVRDRLFDRARITMTRHREQNVRRVYYLSLEYLMGRLLSNNLQNLEIYDKTAQALESLGQDIGELCAEEPDMGLGNGGLGRLAACFIDSMATVDVPAVGYGIHYEFGLFRQEFKDGRQVEKPDAWTRFGNPWKITRPTYAVSVPLYGRVETKFNDLGEGREYWVDTSAVIGVPWDIPVVGFGSDTVNFLRLWESRASHEFNLQVFNDGGYVEAVHEKAVGETISKVLYPNDSTESGKELRLIQQYFFVCCSLHDIIRRHRRSGNDWDNFIDKVAIQLNDTHPAVAVPELMRILLDEENLSWDFAFSLCQKVFAYTNHTLLPEALETWEVSLFEKILPRHLRIIYRINQEFLDGPVEAKWPGDASMKKALSLIEESGSKKIRMAYLSVLTSHSTNGVAELHSRLIKEKLFPDFYALFPNRFNNKTNGITPRRWLLDCNPSLSSLITETLGNNQWPKNLDALCGLESHADNAEFQNRFLGIKRENKRSLAKVILDLCGVEVDPEALFDVQIKRLHEYKRQHLNLLHILTLYRRLLQNPELEISPRVFIFAAKAAPGYYLAKNIIHAINSVANRVNHDPRVRGLIKVVYLPNYGVSLAEKIIPASDLSEQISTAGKEASGTGNMKLSLNGSLTIGTLDGANVEIMEEVGADNFFLFGLTVEEVEALRASGYRPWDYYWKDEELRAVIDWISSDFFTGDRTEFLPLRNSLLDGGDPFLVLADYRAYIEAQERVDAAWKDRAQWAKMAILNTARMGKFSSDRTIREYASEIWSMA